MDKHDKKLEKEAEEKSKTERLIERFCSQKAINLTVAILTLMAIFGVVIIILYFIRFWGGFRWEAFSTEQSVWGAFGDLFNGILGPILTFSVLIAAIITLRQQRIEIVNQNRESKKQEDERKKTTFENSFFRLLENHYELVNSVIYREKRTQCEHRGRLFFRDSVEWLKGYLTIETKKLFCKYFAEQPKDLTVEYSNLIREIVKNTTIDSFFIEDREHALEILAKIKEDAFVGDQVNKEFVSILLKQQKSKREEILLMLIHDPRISVEMKQEQYDLLMQFYSNTYTLDNKLRIHKSAWVAYYDEFGGESGFYFRNLKNTLGFIEEKSPEEVDKKRYGKLLRAQLSRFEIALLFYNCLSDKTSLSFNTFVSKDKFNLLKGLYSTDLFDWLNWQELFDERTIELLSEHH